LAASFAEAAALAASRWARFGVCLHLLRTHLALHFTF
jgi:hypothetical protein